ncbi:MAG: phytoene/squalene synthase family protein [Acuticoccus sp.]
MDFAPEVRAADRNAYLTILFAPEAVRPALYALCAYGLELDRIVARAREPLAAEVRLQWWRDAIRGEGYGEGAAAAPLVAALFEARATFGWPADTLAAMSDARIHDLYADPFDTLDDFDGYAGEVHSLPLQLAAIAMAVHGRGAVAGSAVARSAASAAGYGGVALAAADTLLTETARLAAGRTHIPRTVWQETGAPPIEELLAAATTPAGFADALRALARHGLAADERMTAELASVDTEARGALLPALWARPILEAGLKRPLDVRAPGPLRAQWRIWRNARSLAKG